jgi:hypothetical protein
MATPAEVEARAADVVPGVQEVLGTVIPVSLDRARAVVDEAAQEYREHVPALEHDLAARPPRVERRARKVSRRRTRRRGGTVLVIVLGVGGVVAYAAWRARRGEGPSPAEQPLDPRVMDAAGPGAPAGDGDVTAGRSAG